MNHALFEHDGDRFRHTESSREPWSLDSLHGGPPAALLARHLEALAPPHMDLVRLTVEILRPIPVAPIVVAGTVVRPGRRVANSMASLIVDEQIFATATAVHIRRHEGMDLAVPPLEPPPGPDGPASQALPVLSGERTFSDAVETRYLRGHGFGPGPTSVWMRMRIPTVAGSESSPFEEIVALADCGNGLSWWAAFDEVMFPNPDLTVDVHRRPADDWILLEASSVWEPDGFGLAQSRLSDGRGTIGHSLQSLFIARK